MISRPVAGICLATGRFLLGGEYEFNRTVLLRSLKIKRALSELQIS